MDMPIASVSHEGKLFNFGVFFTAPHKTILNRFCCIEGKFLHLSTRRVIMCYSHSVSQIHHFFKLWIVNTVRETLCLLL